MDNIKLIENIYNNTKNLLLKNIEEKYKQEFLLSYMEYLRNAYLNLKTKNDDISFYTVMFSNYEQEKWNNYSANKKLSSILKDEAFKNIKLISCNGLKSALDKKNNNEIISNEEANKNIAQLKELLPLVREFNYEMAQQQVSDGTLDFAYASNQTEDTSLRVGKVR